MQQCSSQQQRASNTRAGDGCEHPLATIVGEAIDKAQVPNGSEHPLATGAPEQAKGDGRKHPLAARSKLTHLPRYMLIPG